MTPYERHQAIIAIIGLLLQDGVAAPAPVPVRSLIRGVEIRLDAGRSESHGPELGDLLDRLVHADAVVYGADHVLRGVYELAPALRSEIGARSLFMGMSGAIGQVAGELSRRLEGLPGRPGSTVFVTLDGKLVDVRGAEIHRPPAPAPIVDERHDIAYTSPHWFTGAGRWTVTKPEPPAATPPATKWPAGGRRLVELAGRDWSNVEVLGWCAAFAAAGIAVGATYW